MSDKKDASVKQREDIIDQEIEILTVGNKHELQPQLLSPRPKSVNLQQNERQPSIRASPAVQQPEDQKVEQQIVIRQTPSKNHLSVGDIRAEEKIREDAQNSMQQQNNQQSQNISSQSQQDDSNPQSNVSKSNLKQIAKSPEDSNEQRREDVPTSRKCFNKLCSSKKIYKKIRSRVQENKYRFFCRTCYQNYYNNRYCEFCEQVYSNTGENQDDDNWIGCDHCERWNHIQCQRRYRNCNVKELRDKDLLYQCLVCSQKSKLTNDKTKKDREQTDQRFHQHGKHKVQINKEQRTPIFHKKHQSFPNLEYFLQTYSFRLWMNEGQIRQDIEHLRTHCLRLPQQEQLAKGKYKKTKVD